MILKSLLTWYIIYIFISSYVDGCFVCISVYHRHALCPERPEGGGGSNGTGVTDDLSLHVDAVSNPGPLDEQQVLKNTESSFHALNF